MRLIFVKKSGKIHEFSLRILDKNSCKLYSKWIGKNEGLELAQIRWNQWFSDRFNWERCCYNNGWKHQLWTFFSCFETHLSFKSDKKTTLDMGSHRISKAKRNLMGVCMIKIEYPQNNLNEFCSGLVGNDHVAIFTMD